MAQIQEEQPNVGGDVAQLELDAFLVGGINGAAALKGSSLFSDKLDTHPPCDSAIALLGIYPRKNKIHPYGETRALCLTPNSQNWKQPSA